MVKTNTLLKLYCASKQCSHVWGGGGETKNLWNAHL